MSWKSKLAGLIVISILIGVAYTNQDYIKEILNHGITNNPPICPSAFTYTIYKDSILTYQKNSSGQIVDSNSDPAIVINNALWDCSEAGKGSVYVVTNTYTVKQLIGANPIYNNRYSNIYLMFGAGTIIQRSSGSGASDYMFTLHNFNGITSNFTLASNGTTTFIGNNYASGFDIFNTDHFTMINMKFEHLVGIGGGMTKCRYPYLENIEVFDPCMSYTSFLLGMEQIQYGTFKNMNLNANYRYDTCLEGMFFGMEDWIDFANGWDGSYNNAFSKLWIRNMRRNAVYLSGGDYN